MSRNLVKIWEREYTLHRMVGVVDVLSTPFAKKHQGFAVTETAAVHLSNGNEAFCADSKEWSKFIKFLTEVFYSSKKFKNYLSLYNQTKKDLLQASHLANKASASNLAKSFQQFYEADRKFMVIGQWWSYYLAEISAQEIQNLFGSQRDKIDAVLSPEDLTQFWEERKHLLKIYLAPKNRQQKLLDIHVRKFNWIPCINIFNPPPWDEKFFSLQLKQIKSRTKAQKELVELKNLGAKNKRNFQKILRQLPKPQRILANHAHMMAFLKDDRDDIRRQAYYNARPLYQLIAKVLKVNEKNLLYFTPYEIIESLKQGKSLPKKDLKQRQQGYALLLERGKLVTLTGNKYKQVLKLIENKRSSQNIVQGIVACPGKVRGMAKIVPGIFQLSKVRKGDILITVVTHPDYLPAMRIAKAIVTDEGGLTSHAAIVSRELKIPCIVGTKHATSVFKDGDKIEVDANKGTVKKL